MAPNLPSNPKGLSSTTPDGLVAPPAAKVQKTEGFSVMAEAKPEHYHAGNKLTILVDMDNTLCDWEGAFEACMKAKFPEVALVPAEGRLNWDISKDYPAAAADKVKAVSGTPGFFSEMKAVEGGVEAVKAMAAAGHNRANGLVKMKRRASFTMLPQSGSGGGSPMPRKPRVPIVKMA